MHALIHILSSSPKQVVMNAIAHRVSAAVFSPKKTDVMTLKIRYVLYMYILMSVSNTQSRMYDSPPHWNILGAFVKCIIYMFRAIKNLRNLYITLHILGNLKLRTSLEIAQIPIYVCNLGREVLTSRKCHGSQRPPLPLQSWAIYQLLWQPSFVCSFHLSHDHPRPLRLVSKRHYCSIALTSVPPFSNKMAV